MICLSINLFLLSIRAKVRAVLNAGVLCSTSMAAVETDKIQPGNLYNHTIIALQYPGVLPNIIKHHIVFSDPLVDIHLRSFSTIVINCLGYRAASLWQFWHPLLLQPNPPLQVYISTKRYDVQKKYGCSIEPLKKRLKTLLSIILWLFNRDALNGLLYVIPI